MVVTSPVEICNLALSLLEMREISSIYPASTNEEAICARWYDTVRRAALRDYVWNFARKLAVLTYTPAITPAFGYDRAFYIPTDCLRVLSLGDHTINADLTPDEYTIAGNAIYTNSSTGTELDIEYVYDNLDVTQYDPAFIELISLRLADTLALRFGVGGGTLDRIKMRLQEVELRAAALAGQEKPPRVRKISKLLTIRRFGRGVSNKYYD